MTTDTLAAQQLELLYRLGVLARDAPASHEGQSIRTSTSTSNVERYTVAAATDAASPGASNTVAAVHPLRLTGSSTPESLRQPTSTRQFNSMTRCQYEHEQHSALQLTRQEQTRTWFLRWKLFVRSVHELRSVCAIRRFRVKTRAWSALLSHTQLQQRLRLAARVLQEQWKVRRTAHKWSLWACNSRQLRLLHDNTRDSLMNRLRRRRTWLRWRCFAATSAQWRVIYETQQRVHGARLRQAVWNELKAFTCRRRQRRREMRKCVLALKQNVGLAEAERSWLRQTRDTMDWNTKRRLLRAWRLVAQLKAVARRIQGRIALEISRKRYFRVWRRCLRNIRRIAAVQVARRARLLREHTVAWKFVTRALGLAQRKSSGSDRSTRARHFQAWRCETNLALQLQTAILLIDRLRQVKAVRRLRSWALERQTRHEKLETWRIRVLAKVWQRGWLPFHAAQQATKAEAKQLERELQQRCFRVWTRFWRVHVDCHAALHRASLIAPRALLKRCFARWTAHRRLKALCAQQVARGDKYHCIRLLQRGVDELAHHVARRSELSQRNLRIRRRMRAMARARCFTAWKQWTREAQANKRLICCFRAREAYQRSWFNARRRAWEAWRVVVHLGTQLKSVEAQHRVTSTRRVLHQWRHRVHLHGRVYSYRQQRRMKTLETALSCWRSRTSRWQNKREMLALAEAVYRRKRNGHVLFVWVKSIRSSAKLKERFRQLKSVTVTKALAVAFQAWSTRWHQRTTSTRLAAVRHTHWKVVCLVEWREFGATRARLQRKLVYFRQVFGAHPTTSLVRRGWQRWRQFARTSRGVRSLQRRQNLRIARTSWRHWALFHSYHLLFRAWRRVAAHTAVATRHRGKRLRLFRACSKDRFASLALKHWRAYCAHRTAERETFSRKKQRLMQAIGIRHAQLSLARTRYTHKWLSRWRRAVNARGLPASRYYHARLARKVLVVWWRFMVNAKQEFVLTEAKQVLGGLSYYHPHQQLYTRIVKEKAQPLRATAKVKRRESEMKQKRRMLDPQSARRYLGSGLGDREAATHMSKAEKARKPTVRSSRCQHLRDADLADPEHKENDARNLLSVQDSALTRHASVRKPRPLDTRPVSCRPTSSDQQRCSKPALNHTVTQGDLSKHPDRSLPELPLFDSPPHPQQLEGTIRQQEAWVDTISRVTCQERLRRGDEVDRSKEQPLVSPQSDGVRSESTQPHGGEVAPATRISAQEHLSLSQLASMELLAPPPPPPPPQAPFVSENARVDIRASRMVRCEVPLPPQSRKVAETHRRSERSRGKATQEIAIQSSPPGLSLAAILKVPGASKRIREIVAAKSASLERAAVPTERDEKRKPSASDVLRQVLEYYSEQLAGQRMAADAEMKDISASHKRVCFRMLRDLGLFHNQFYLPQMERAIDALSLDRIAFARERLRATDGSDERRYLRQLETTYLEEFLDNAIGSHPLFDLRALKPEACVSGTATTTSVSIEKLTLQWLVSVHLRAKSDGRSCSEKPFWINSALPSEVIAALEKLLLCVTKYCKVLAQLFITPLSTRQRQQLNSDRSELSKLDFTKVLKLMHVFPQLLTRHEVENAFDAACCARTDQKAINFPEFVEALIRCSFRMSWGDSTASDSDTGVVVRFLMLLFAMEGKGTVLQKRSDDLHVVVGFLEQQQAQSKAAKLRRFRFLLAHQKRDYGTALPASLGSSGRSVNRRSSRPAPERNKHSSPRRSDKSQLFVFEDSCGTSAFSRRIANFDLGLEAVADLADATRVSEYDLNDPIELASPEDFLGNRRQYAWPTPMLRSAAALTQQQSFDSSLIELTAGTDPTLSVAGAERSQGHWLSPTRERLGGDPAEPGGESSGVGDHSASAINGSAEPQQGEHSKMPRSLYRVGELQDGDAFVREILSSIGDVELLLQHSTLQVPSSAPHLGEPHSVLSVCWQPVRLTRCVSCASTVQTERPKSEDEYSDDIELESSKDLLPSSVMRSLFTSGNTLVQLDIGVRDGDELLVDHVEDVPVNDPMLNQLTDVERFTDSGALCSCAVPERDAVGC